MGELYWGDNLTILREHLASDWMPRDYPRMQIVTIGELLHGVQTAIPIRYKPYQLAELARRPGQSQQQELFSTGS